MLKRDRRIHRRIVTRRTFVHLFPARGLFRGDRSPGDDATSGSPGCGTALFLADRQEPEKAPTFRRSRSRVVSRITMDPPPPPVRGRAIAAETNERTSQARVRQSEFPITQSSAGHKSLRLTYRLWLAETLDLADGESSARSRDPADFTSLVGFSRLVFRGVR